MLKVTVTTGQQDVSKTFSYKSKTMLISDVLKREGFDHETPCGCVGVCGKCIVGASGDLSEPTELEIRLGLIERGQRLSCTTYIRGNAEIIINNQEKKLHVSHDDLEVSMQSSGSNHLTGEYGIAFDIGTTGVSAQLIDLQSGEIHKRKSVLNPQSKYGGDVLTRICYANDNEDGIHHLQSAIGESMTEIIEAFTSVSGGKRPSRTYVAGNTTMQHLIGGVNPSSIAKAPYTPVFLETREVVLTDLSFKKPSSNKRSLSVNLTNKSGNKLTSKSTSKSTSNTVTLLPSASGYIGADIIAGIYATDFHKISQDKENSENVLLIDIGTNGEIVMSSGQGLSATSTAAGPALEGMNITCGMRAEEGAIDRFSIDPSGALDFSTIGDKAPVGICGSGLIDIMAELVDKNIVLKNGRFNKNMDVCLSERFDDKKFYITESIFISQKDIRQIQLAKGAIAAGITLLYKEENAKMENCSKVLIAGSFGYHLSEASIRKIGLIPSLLSCPVEFVGNTSLKGASRALTANGGIEELEKISESIKVLELSRSAEFQDVFVSELGF